MRLILPSGEYVVDGLADLSRVTLTDVVTFERACGVDYYAARDAMASMVGGVRTGLLAGDDVAELREQIVRNTNLGSILWWLIWLCRHTAGERQRSGAPLTVEEAGAITPDDISFRLDPGDEPKPVEDEPPDPSAPRSAGGRGGKSKPKQRSASGSTASTVQS